MQLDIEKRAFHPLKAANGHPIELMTSIRMFCVPLLVLLAAFTACKPSPKKVMDVGVLQGNTYSNSFLGMSVVIPEGWTVQNKSEMSQLQETGKKLFAGENDKLQKDLEANQNRTASLLLLFRHPLGTEVSFNQNLIFQVEELPATAGITTARQYLDEARKLMLRGALKFELAPEYQPAQISGRDFEVMTGKLTLPTMTVMQDYYATIRDGYVLLLILSYGDEQQHAELKGIIGDIRFN